MPVNYHGRIILSLEEFVADRDSGGFHPNSTYEGYLRMIEQQLAMAEQARAEAAALGFELKGPEPPEMTPEDEVILDRIWAELAVEKKAAESAVRAA